MTPNRTLAATSDTTDTQGRKQQKDRITVLLACNWAGSCKAKPLVIGRSAHPRCFHHTAMASLPTVYQSSKNAWMTSEIFSNWFKDTFIPAVRHHLQQQGLPVKAVLLLENCPAHPPAETLVSRCGGIRVVFLPKNTTSKIQPLDQGKYLSL